jgi:hypothetical protein
MSPKRSRDASRQENQSDRPDGRSRAIASRAMRHAVSFGPVIAVDSVVPWPLCGTSEPGESRSLRDEVSRLQNAEAFRREQALDRVPASVLVLAVSQVPANAGSRTV